MERWMVFYHGDKELAAHTLRGSFTGEKEAVIELLAGEHGIPEDEIRTEIEMRGGKKCSTSKS